MLTSCLQTCSPQVIKEGERALTYSKCSAAFWEEKRMWILGIVGHSADTACPTEVSWVQGHDDAATLSWVPDTLPLQLAETVSWTVFHCPVYKMPNVCIALSKIGPYSWLASQRSTVILIINTREINDHRRHLMYFFQHATAVPIRTRAQCNQILMYAIYF